MTKEARLYKAAIITGLITKHGLSVIDTDAVDIKSINAKAIYLCDAEPIDDRNNTVAPGRILISDERLRHLKLGYTAEHDDLLGRQLLDKALRCMQSAITQKRAKLDNMERKSIDIEIQCITKAGSLLAAYLDQLLRVRASLQK